MDKKHPTPNVQQPTPCGHTQTRENDRRDRMHHPNRNLVCQTVTQKDDWNIGKHHFHRGPRSCPGIEVFRRADEHRTQYEHHEHQRAAQEPFRVQRPPPRR